MLQTCLLLCALAASAYAHVMLRFDYEGQGPSYPIRNAPSREANGRFSVAGPCGGANLWGANSYVNITDGKEVTLKISYNGGHQSSSNVFTMGFYCVNGTEDIPESVFRGGAHDLECAGVPSPEGRITPPYVVTCNLKDQALLQGQSKKCTISVHDQRSWGGCVDAMIVGDDVPPPVNPAPSAPLQVIQYKVGQIIHNAKGDNACCNFTSSSLEVTPGSDKIHVEGVLCDDCGHCWNDRVDLFRGAVNYLGQTTIGGEAFELTYVNSILTITNVGKGEPTICDAIAYDPDACSSPTSEAKCLDAAQCQCARQNGINEIDSATLGGGVFVGVLVIAAIVVLVILTMRNTISWSFMNGPRFKYVLLGIRILQFFLAIVAMGIMAQWGGTTGIGLNSGGKFAVAAGVLSFLYAGGMIGLFIFSSVKPQEFKDAIPAQKMSLANTILDSVLLLLTLVAAIFSGAQSKDVSSAYKGSVAMMYFLCFSFVATQLFSIIRVWKPASDGDMKDDVYKTSDYETGLGKGGYGTGGDVESTANEDSHSNNEEIAVAEYDYTAQREDELSLKQGDKIIVTSKGSDGWWQGRLQHTNQHGAFPGNYAKLQ